MRVLYVVSLFPCWSETFIVREIKALKNKGVHIDILSLKHPHEDMVQSDSESLAESVVYPEPFFKGQFKAIVSLLKHPVVNIKYFFHSIWEMKRRPASLAKTLVTHWRSLAVLDKIQRLNVDHIHAHWATYPSTSAMIISENLSIPFSFTSHAHDIFLEDQLLNQKFSHCKFAITISRFNIKHLKSLIAYPVEKKINVVHCGIELDQFPIADNGRTENSIMAVGRFDEIKGFSYLLDACYELQKKSVNFECNIIGDGPLKNELSRKLNDLGLTESVKLLGVRPQEEVKALLNSSEIFVLPSVKTSEGNMDGIPVALMEAMAVGTPVISTRVSGIPELIEHDDNGLICEPRNAKDLAEKIESMLKDKEKQKNMAMNARKKIEQEFEINTEAEKLLSLI